MRKSDEAKIWTQWYAERARKARESGEAKAASYYHQRAQYWAGRWAFWSEFDAIFG